MKIEIAIDMIEELLVSLYSKVTTQADFRTEANEVYLAMNDASQFGYPEFYYAARQVENAYHHAAYDDYENEKPYIREYLFQAKVALKVEMARVCEDS